MGVRMLIAVSSLGYFVDGFDLRLFSVVRRQSRLDLVVAEVDTLRAGLALLNWQMAGLLAAALRAVTPQDARGWFAAVAVVSIETLSCIRGQ